MKYDPGTPVLAIYPWGFLSDTKARGLWDRILQLGKVIQWQSCYLDWGKSWNTLFTSQSDKVNPPAMCSWIKWILLTNAAPCGMMSHFLPTQVEAGVAPFKWKMGHCFFRSCAVCLNMALERGWLEWMGKQSMWLEHRDQCLQERPFTNLKEVLFVPEPNPNFDHRGGGPENGHMNHFCNGRMHFGSHFKTLLSCQYEAPEQKMLRCVVLEGNDKCKILSFSLEDLYIQDLDKIIGAPVWIKSPATALPLWSPYRSSFSLPIAIPQFCTCRNQVQIQYQCSLLPNSVYFTVDFCGAKNWVVGADWITDSRNTHF